MFSLSVRQCSLVLLTVLIVLSLLTSSLPQVQASGEKVVSATDNATSTAASLPFGYGLVMANARDEFSAQQMGFNWTLVFDPPTYSNPQALLRIKVTAADAADLYTFSQRLSKMNLGTAAAIQIGNEPNLISEWGAPPDASNYKKALCMAHNALKEVQPGIIIVSGGLAPTGRVPGIWNGHSGHDGLRQDEREFLKELILAGGGNCLDVMGYNALGFRANYDAAPDVIGGTPDTDCANGLCFRSVEKAHEIMQTLGFGNKPIWATEVGWLTAPPEHCLTDSRWPSRIWQIVTPQKQADNLVGAFRYARLHWPWMKAMFVFNLDFSSVPWYDECEQMRYYSVNQQPTYDALVAMPKVWAFVYLPLIHK